MLKAYLAYCIQKLTDFLHRAFTVSGRLKPEEAVQATLSSLPDEVVDTVGVTSLPSGDSVSERRRKLEFLEMQEELIKVHIRQFVCPYTCSVKSICFALE